MTNQTIDAMVLRLDLVEAQIKELKALADGMKSDLKDELMNRQVDCIDTGVNRLHLSEYEKSSIDTASLKKAGLYEFYIKKSTAARFTITKTVNN